jgi:PAS domain S-box-containing protein
MNTPNSEQFVEARYREALQQIRMASAETQALFSAARSSIDFQNRAALSQIGGALQLVYVVLAEAQSLYRVARSLIGTNNLSDLFQVVVNSVAEALPATQVTLIMVDLETQQITHFVKGGPRVNDTVEVSFADLWEGLVGWTLRERKPALSPKGIPDVRESLTAQRQRAEANVGSILVAPLLYQDKIFGALIATNPPEDRNFVEQDMELMMAMACQIDIAIENVRLYQELQSVNAELEQRVADRTAELVKANTSLKEEIIARLRSEQALIEERGLLRTLINSLPVAIYVKDTESRFLVANEAISLIMGGSVHEIIGKTDFEFYSKELAAQYYADERAIIESGQPLHNKEEIIVDAANNRRWFLTTKVPFFDNQGTVKGIIGIGQDITERRQMEEALRERDRLQLALEKEKEINTIKNNMMRTISHEFRTPLAIILSASSLLTRYGERLEAEERQKRLASIEEQVHKLDQMVEEIVSTMRGVFSDFTFQAKRVDLELLGQLAVNELHSTIGIKHNMTFECEGQLQRVLIDERLIKRILVNLLSNAIKYSPEGRLIRLRMAEEQENICIQVIDQGIGISAEDQKRLFDPFFRASNATEITGIGLGLSIVRDCVVLHQGTITVDSELNKGTTFTISLPKLPNC